MEAVGRQKERARGAVAQRGAGWGSCGSRGGGGRGPRAWEAGPREPLEGPLRPPSAPPPPAAGVRAACVNAAR